MIRVTIEHNSSLDKAYGSIREMLDSRYNQAGNSFELYHISPAEQVDISTLSSYAAHASDNLHIGNTHIERLIT